MQSSHRRHGYPSLLWLSASASLLGAFQYGYHLSVLNTALHVIKNELNFSENTGGAVVTTALLIGGCCGALLAGQAADKFGPKRAQLYNQVWLLFGAVVACWSPWGIWGLFLGRVLSGVGCGAATLLTPRYLTEVAPTSVRGALGTQNQVFCNIGIFVSILMGLPYEFKMNNVKVLGYEIAWWRLMLLASMLPSALQALLLWPCPESPVWLDWKGKGDEADDNFVALWGHHALLPDDFTDSEVTSRILEPRASHEPLGWRELWQPMYRRMVVLAVTIAVLQQLSGINTIIFYSSMVLSDAGVQAPILGSVFVSVANLVFTVMAGCIVDQAGRKRLLLVSHGGMAACLLAEFILWFTIRDEFTFALLSFLAIMLFVMFFAIGAGPVPWLYIAEILPDNVKGRGAAVATAANWAVQMIISITFLHLEWRLEIGPAYLIFFVLNVVAVICIAKMVLETNHLSLHQIQRELLGGSGGEHGDAPDALSIASAGSNSRAHSSPDGLRRPSIQFL